MVNPVDFYLFDDEECFQKVGILEFEDLLVGIRFGADDYRDLVPSFAAAVTLNLQGDGQITFGQIPPPANRYP